MATSNPKQELLAILLELVDEEFKTFKWHLNQHVQDGCNPIPKCHLEKADREDVVDQIYQVYGLGALKIMEVIKTKMERNAVKEKERKEQEEKEKEEKEKERKQKEEKEKLITCQAELKKDLTKKLEVDEGIHAGTENPDRPVPVEKLYIPLYITEMEQDLSDEQHEERQIQRAKQGTEIDCNKIFQTEQDKPILTVLTKGVAGIGKTVSMMKFIHDWIERKENDPNPICPNPKFVFPLLFRDLSLVREDKFSLIDLLHKYFHVLKKVTSTDYLNSNDVLFILDGLDEFQPQLDFKKKSLCCEITTITSLDQLLMNLIGRDLLPNARIWITSRPAAANQIPPKYVDRLTEVCGFTDDQIEKYFKKNISDAEIANSVIKHVQSIQSLHTMCKIPVFSWISAKVLKELYSTKSAEIPRTLTQMYIHFLDFQIKKEQTDLESLWKIFEKLGKLAFEQLKSGNLVFEENVLAKYNLVVGEVSGVCNLKIFKSECGMTKKMRYEFVHLSIQELFAALYVFLSFHIDNINVIDQDPTTPQHASVYESAIDLALRSENGQYDLFVRFLLGLSLKKNQNLKLLAYKLEQQGNNPQDREKTVAYIKEKIRLNQNSERCINLFDCLNELDDSSLVVDILRFMKEGRLAKAELAQVKPTRRFFGRPATTVTENPDEPVLKITPEQLSALAFILLTSNTQLDEFDMREYSRIPEEGLLRLMPVVKASKKAVLIHLADKGCSDLASILKSKACALRHLDLSNNDLQPSRLKDLAVGLTNEECKLESLTLTNCQIKSCDFLASMLSSKTSTLRGLDLSWNKIKDSGVQELCTGLKSPNCKLETLELRGCDITDTGCGYLKSALVKHSRLTELDLKRNKIGQSGAKMLLDLQDKRNSSLKTLTVDPVQDAKLRTT